MNVEEIRERIPALKKCVHLNCAAVSPQFSDTIREMQDFLKNRGGKANFDFFKWLEMENECRKKLAELVNASEEEIAFMLNTSQGVNTVANMIDWKKGDNVITTDLEFPSNIVPWYNLRKRGVEVKKVKNVKGEIRIEDIEKAIDENTRLVAISYVQFCNGFRADLKEIAKICREHNAFLFSDVIQGMGAVKLDVKKAGLDFFAAASYKWLMGPLGVGIFYMRKDLIEEFDPPYAGWYSLKKEEDFDRPGIDKIEFAETARKFETGGTSFALIKGLKKSLEILLETGMNEIEKRVLKLSEYLIDNAENVQTPESEKKRAGIVNIKNSNAEKIVEKLRNRNILVSARMGGIRVSTHFWNTEEDIDLLLKHIQ